MNTLMATLSKATHQSHVSMYQNQFWKLIYQTELKAEKNFVLKIIVKYFRQQISIYDRNKLLYELDNRSINRPQM